MAIAFQLHNFDVEFVGTCVPNLTHRHGDLSFTTRKFNTYFNQSSLRYLLGFILY